MTNKELRLKCLLEAADLLRDIEVLDEGAVKTAKKHRLDKYLSRYGYKDEKISRLLTESTELLNEGAVGKIFTGLLIAPFVIPIGLVSVALLYNKISDIKTNHQFKKLIKKDKMVEIDNAILTNYKKLEKLVKFAKYNPIVILMMNDYMAFSKKFDEKLEAIDTEFEHIKSKDEFYKKKNYFEKKYYEYNKELKSEYEKLILKYKNPKDEWVEGTDVVPILTKFIELYHDWNGAIYGKNTDGDDYWEGIDFLRNYWENDDSEDDVFEDAYEIYSYSSEGGSQYMKTKGNDKDPFKYIKLQFSGEKVNDDK